MSKVSDASHPTNPNVEKADRQVALMARVVVVEACWEWTGARSMDGYGRLGTHRKTMPAHRAFYEAFVGEIPKGLEIDHLCRNRQCMNPAHMEPVTHRENTLRGNTVSGLASRMTRCSRGHLLAGDNLAPSSRGRRVCVICQTDRNRRNYVIRKAAALNALEAK